MPRTPKGTAPSRSTPKRTPKKAETPKESPKKVKKAAPKKASTGAKKKSHPTYYRMIFKAITDLGEGRSGSSQPAIAKYMETKYTGVPEKFKRYMRIYLAKGVDAGFFGKVKASYRITSKGNNHFGRKKRSTKRKSRKSTDGSEKKRKSTSKSPRSKSTGEKKERKKASPKKARNSAPTASTSSSSTATATATATPPSMGRKKSSGVSKAKSKEGPESVPRPTGLKGDYVWQYFDKNWKNYDNDASDTVEDVYQKYLQNRGDTDVRAVKSGQWEYMVDFMALKQTNIQHENHTTRNIRRVKVA